LPRWGICLRQGREDAAGFLADAETLLREVDDRRCSPISSARAAWSTLHAPIDRPRKRLYPKRSNSPVRSTPARRRI
jgi:hypothetical protein